MSMLKTLVKRELWEYRTLIVYLPLVVTAFSILLLCFIFFKLEALELDTVILPESLLVEDKPLSTDRVEVKGLEGLASIPFEVREDIYNGIYVFLGFPLWGAFFLVAVFYFVQSLYQDRKDRSILFWKSMPVSDGLTVASKLITGFIVAPLITCLCVMILQLALLLMASVYALNFDVDIWATLWEPSHLFARWFSSVFFLLLYLIWSLPIYTWILLVSSASRSIPFAWVIGIPFSLVLLQMALTLETRGGSSEQTIVGGFLVRHLEPTLMQRTQISENGGMGLIRGLENIMGFELVFSIALSIVFVIGAIKFRGRAGLL